MFGGRFESGIDFRVFFFATEDQRAGKTSDRFVIGKFLLDKRFGVLLPGAGIQVVLVQDLERDRPRKRSIGEFPAGMILGRIDRFVLFHERKFYRTTA